MPPHSIPVHDRTWYHGRALSDPPWQHDPAHPGVWLASRPNAARWYAGDDGQVLRACLNERTPAPLDLRDNATFDALIRAAQLDARGLRRAHTRGHLYLIGEGDVQNRLVQAAFAQDRALIMRDHTAGVNHLSLVVATSDALTLHGPVTTRSARPLPAPRRTPITETR